MSNEQTVADMRAIQVAQGGPMEPKHRMAAHAAADSLATAFSALRAYYVLRGRN